MLPLCLGARINQCMTQTSVEDDNVPEYTVTTTKIRAVCQQNPRLDQLDLCTPSR